MQKTQVIQREGRGQKSNRQIKNFKWGLKRLEYVMEELRKLETKAISSGDVRYLMQVRTSIKSAQAAEEELHQKITKAS